MKKNPVFIILGILFGLNILAWLAIWDLSEARGLEVTFFDIGQGDSIFIETPSGHQILIDGGPGEKVIEKLAKEMPFWDRTIDLIILTHPEHDHISGLIEVLKRYKVENILWTGVLRDTAEYGEWKRLIKEEGADIYIAQVSLAVSDTARLKVLFPFESFEGKEVKNTNNTSIITRLIFGEISFLFTGDAYQSVERLVLNRVKHKLDSDVLKVGHHGSKTSSCKEFIEAVSPEIAVIQCGKDNSYGHPHPETLQTLEGIKVFRTDLDGDVKIISDGLNYQIK